MNVTVFEAINITKKYRNTLALNQVFTILFHRVHFSFDCWRSYYD